MKKILRIAIVLLIAFFLVRLCTNRLGTIIPGGNSNTTTEQDGGTGSGDVFGDWLRKRTSGGSGDEFADSGKSIKDISEELERQLGVDGATAEPEPKVTRNATDFDATASGSHLTFKGREITGTRSAFMDFLRKQGFTVTGSDALTGKFAGFSGCTVKVNGDNPVSSISVLFPKTSDWNALEKDYDSIQAMLTQKYGQPKVDVNRATFKTDNGDIILDAYVKGEGNWYVTLDYIDGNVGILTGTSAIDDL